MLLLLATTAAQANNGQTRQRATNSSQKKNEKLKFEPRKPFPFGTRYKADSRIGAGSTLNRRQSWLQIIARGLI
jgi:hypothetical protein